MEDVHPSLMQYMSLFPASALSPDFNAYPDLNATAQSLDQSILNGVSAFPQFTSNTQPPAFSYQGPSMPSSMQQNQTQSRSSSFSYDPASFDAYQHSYSTAPTDASTPESGSNDFADLGMMMNGDSGIDEQWMSFMRESGIINTSTNS